MNSSLRFFAAKKPIDVNYAATMPRIAIERVQPVIDNGRFCAKAVVGWPVCISAVIFCDGHEKIKAEVVWSDRSGIQQSVAMIPIGNDVWETSLVFDDPTLVMFMIRASIDVFGSYYSDLSKKIDAGQDVSLDVDEGIHLIHEAKPLASAKKKRALFELWTQLDNLQSVEEKTATLLSAPVRKLLDEADVGIQQSHTDYYALDVERSAAGFASWYELFPRSITDSEQRHGTFLDVIGRLDYVKAMGFDVLYFPPIHPIGQRYRKGRNNSLRAQPDDPGSPYAIGSAAGGHDAFHPELGTLEDFAQLVEAARSRGLEVALDFAIQCSPDHPWLTEHAGWFRWRTDGSIRYAENPPKKYQDIVNVDFYAPDAIPELWEALRNVILSWVDRGVTIFRVDNPHTKPLPFWEWVIADVRSRHPRVIFLAEAFTRPAMMARLGKLGFSQSYTYFTWRNTKQELESYFTQLNTPPLSNCFRPNFFVNTPDINPYFLHNSGRAGFLIRAALAAMGSGLWGMYSGFELCESQALDGKEEYLDSEKYQIKLRDYHAEGNIVSEITRLNQIRKENPALHTHLGLQIYNVWNDNIILFGKRTDDLSNFILIAVSLDPHSAQEAHFEIPLWEFGLPDDALMHAEDLMNGDRWTWYGKVQWMRIEPWHLPFGIWRLFAPDTESNNG